MKINLDLNEVQQFQQLHNELNNVRRRLDTLEASREMPKYIQPPQPPAAGLSLVEAVDRLLRDDHFWTGYKEDTLRLYHALTAERKRAELVKEAFREYKAGHVTNCACRACEALRALDAFDKGTENG